MLQKLALKQCTRDKPKQVFFSSYVYLYGYTQICGFNRVNAEACLFGLIWPSKSLIKDYFRICWRKKDHLQLTLMLALASNFWRWLRARFHTVHLEFIIIFILWHHWTANIIFILWHHYTANIIFLLRHHCTAKINFIRACVIALTGSTIFRIMKDIIALPTCKRHHPLSFGERVWERWRSVHPLWRPEPSQSRVAGLRPRDTTGPVWGGNDLCLCF